MIVLWFVALIYAADKDEKEYVPIGKDTCTCVSTTGFCDADCTSEYKKDNILQKCPKKHFQTSKEDYTFGEWLLREFFCLYYDRRDIQYDKLGTTDSINLSKLEDNHEKTNESENIYGYLIKNTTNQNVFIPSPFLADSKCYFDKLPLEFLDSVDSLQCYYTPGELNDKIQLTIVDQDGKHISNTASIENCNGDYQSIDYQIFYNEDTKKITQYHVKISCYNDYQSSERLLQVQTHYYKDNAVISRMKSGNFGYSHGQPVIASKGKNSQNHFPVPFGYACNESKYTPLLFGYDTIGGCTNNTGEDKYQHVNTILSYRYLSRLGQASNEDQDWIEIQNYKEEFKYCKNLKLNIYYEHIGNINNPQNRIYSAEYECKESPANSDTNFLFVASFLRSGDEKTFRYVPKPKGLPNDTFAPFYEP